MRIATLLGPIAAAWLAGSEASAALSPDVGYGAAGLVTVGVGGVADDAQVVKVDGSGRAVVAGWTLTADGSLTRQDVGVVRLNSNGTVDGTFGVNGHVAIQLGTALLGNAAALAFQADGKILVAGYCTNPSGGSPDMFVARLLANGTLDNSFEGDGVVIVPRVSGHSGRVHAMAVQSSGRILLAGGTAMQFGGQIILALRPDGSLDTAFGTGGIFELHNRGFGAFHDVALLPDGRILAAGVAGDLFNLSMSGGIVFTDLLFVRLLENGTLDTTFGTGGFAEINVGDLAAGDLSMTYDHAWGIALRPDGRIVVAGQATTEFDQFDADTDGFVAQFLSNGAPDLNFGTNHGYTRLPDTGRNESAYDVALLSNGDAIVGGQMRLAQVSPDGRMIHYTDAAVETPALAVQGDDKILLVRPGPIISSRFIIGRYATTALPPADNDTVPDPFTLGSVTTDRFGFLVESAPITITGLTAPAIIFSGNSSFSIGCTGDWRSLARTITNLSVVCVRHASGSETEPVRQTTLSIGGVTSVFTSTAGDGVPNPFSFADQTGVPPSTSVFSAPVTITGITSAPNVGVIDGQVSIGCNDVWVGSGVIRNGQTLCVRHGSSNQPSTVTRTTVTIGGVSDEFSSTTRATSESSPGGGSSGGGSLDWLLIAALLAFQMRRHSLHHSRFTA